MSSCAGACEGIVVLYYVVYDIYPLATELKQARRDEVYRPVSSDTSI